MKKILFVLVGLLLLVGCIQTATVIGFSYEKTSYNLVEGQKEKLNPTITGLSETPRITYVSSNEDAVKVIQENNYFVLSAVGVGYAEITAKLNNVQGKVCTLVARVTAKPVLAISINGEGAIELEIGNTRNFTITNNIAYTETLVWSSDNEEVGTINNNGLFNAVGLGTTLVTATVGSVSDQVMVTVIEEGSIVEPTFINVLGEDSVVIGETIMLTAETDGVGQLTINWSSGKPAIATIDAGGTVTGVSKGMVVILASIAGYPSLIKTKTIEVLDVAPEIIDPTGITLSGPNAVDMGSTINLSATINPTGATGVILWSSNNEDIATINSSGVVTGVSEGVVTITSSLQGNEGITNTYEITVNYVAPAPTSIMVTGPDSVRVGSTISLVAIVSPEGASSAVTWMSLADSTATVNEETGVVIGKAIGTVKIVASSTVNNQIMGTKEIQVTPGPAISIEASVESLYVGETLTVTGVVINSENTNVIYSSSNILIATVDTVTGVVTGVAPGSATIIATAEVDPSLAATIDIVVAYAPAISVLPTESTIAIGQTVALEVVVENLENTAVTFTSNDGLIATVDENGIVTGVAVGEAVITITALGDVTLTTTSIVTVVLAPTIEITPKTATVVAGQTVALTATVHNSANTTVTYSSSNELTATVNSSGVVTALTAGSVIITATAAVDTNLTTTATITITPAPSISMTPTSATINQNEMVTLAATVQNSTNTTVTYASSNTAIATVNATTGVVTGVAAGTATITATAEVNTNLKATATVTVNPAPTLTVAPSTATIAIGATTQLTATITYSTNKNVTWSSSNTAFATVNTSTGLVTAVAAGTATITATAVINSSLKATATITVTPANYTVNYTLNSGDWSWSTGTVSTPANGIDSASTLPEIFMQDFYQYLKDNNLLSSTIVDSTLRKTTWSAFSTLLTDPKASYNMVAPTIVTGNVNGYSQFFWDTVNTSTQTATGGLFGTEPFKTKYANLLVHLLNLYALKSGGVAPNNYNDITSTDPTEIKKCKSGAGFILDGYFYGTQGITGSTNDVAWKALRSKIPTPVLKWNATATSSSATSYQVTSYAYGAIAQLRAPSRVSYIFEGWYNNSGFTGSPITSIAKNVAPAANYYAKWTAAATYGGSTNPTSLTITATKTTFAVAETSQLSITGGHAVTWSSGTTTIATVSATGLVTAIAAGSVTITASLTANPTVKGTITLTVTAAPGALTIKVQRHTNAGGGVYANPTISSISKVLADSEAGYYQVFVFDSTGNPVTRPNCIFTTTNSNVVTVTTYGSIVAVAVGGPITINVKFGTLTGSTVVTVVA